MTEPKDDDRRWMAQALALAALGEGTTSPNPRVGCVVVRDGRVVSQAFHRAAGEPHAEALALEKAGPRARGATLYVNLEPCAHFGRMPPCADLIIERGVRRVVASITDPNPEVNGRGFGRLTGAGIEVAAGLMAARARRLNRGFLRWHATGLPWVTLKAAVSLDGMLAACEGRSHWITGEPARRFAHRLRLRHDAVVVGAETVRRDDPRLTVRLPGAEASRLRVILSAGLRLDPRSHIFEGPGARIYTSASSGERAPSGLEEVADIRRVASRGGELDLRAVLGDLGREGVQSVLVEGGGRTLSSFLSSGLAGEAVVFVAPLLLGSRGGTPMLDGATASEPHLGSRLRETQRIPLGEDLVVLGSLESDAVGRA